MASGIIIINATLDDAENVLLRFSNNVTAGDFTASDFTVPSDVLTGIAVSQFSGDTLDVTLDGGTTVGSFIHYSGTVTGVASPQTSLIGA